MAKIFISKVAQVSFEKFQTDMKILWGKNYIFHYFILLLCYYYLFIFIIVLD